MHIYLYKYLHKRMYVCTTVCGVWGFRAACANPRAGYGAARLQGNGASTRGRSLAGRRGCVVEKLCGRTNS